MRFLHSADWHLGRVYHGVSLLEDQAHVLQQFVRIAADTRPDAILLAGDIYDRSVPPAEAVRLLDLVLSELILELKIPVVMIAGNHDGPDRLAFGSGLLQRAGLVVRGWFSTQTYTQADLKSVRITEFRRLTRKVRLLELDTADDRLLVFTRWDVGTDPINVLDALTDAGLIPQR